MGLFDQIGAYLDARKRVAARNLGDLAADPSGMFGMWGNQVREDLTNNMQQMGAGVTDRGLLGQSISAAMGPVGMAPMGLLGHIVYHGSPHKFDKFDASKIGTGEGAQAYGHGLYLAESPTVASSYKELASRSPDRLKVDGRQISTDTMYGRAAEDVARIGVAATLQKIDDNIRFNDKYAPDIAAQYRSLRENISALDPSRVELKTGSIYKVDLPDEWLPKMLDWDKPLSQQPEIVQKAVASMTPEQRAAINKQTAKMLATDHGDGHTIYNAFGGYKDPAGAARLMAEKGIPGVRYLDGGSRGAGEGTYNYVVFPGMEHLLKILERQ